MVVLEAWCYTRAGGPGVVHMVATRFQGIPELCSSVQIPQMKRWRDIYQELQGALIPARLRHLYQGSVETAGAGVQVFKVHLGSLTSLFILRQLFVPCLYCYCIYSIVYTRWVILITPMPLRR